MINNTISINDLLNESQIRTEISKLVRVMDIPQILRVIRFAGVPVFVVIQSLVTESLSLSDTPVSIDDLLMILQIFIAELSELSHSDEGSSCDFLIVEIVNSASYLKDVKNP